MTYSSTRPFNDQRKQKQCKNCHFPKTLQILVQAPSMHILSAYFIRGTRRHLILFSLSFFSRSSPLYKRLELHAPTYSVLHVKTLVWLRLNTLNNHLSCQYPVGGKKNMKLKNIVTCHK